MPHATKTAIEKVENKTAPESFFVSAEHFFEDFAKHTREVTKRAFELFNARGRQFGNEFEDWLRAEAEFSRRVPIEIKETEKELEIRAQVPGFTADDLKVSVEPLRVTLKGDIEAKDETKEDGAVYSEWMSNKIFRAFTLPKRVDSDKALAVIKNGVLTLTIPKMSDAEPNEVKIETA